MPTRTGACGPTTVYRLKRLRPRPVLLTHAFREAGYQTLGTGKMLHGTVPGLFEEYHGVNQRWSPFPKKAVPYTKSELPQ